MRAACTAASWRASNSDCVMMSPFTLATTRSMISAREEAERARRPAPTRAAPLRRTRTGDGFIIHLGPGHEALDELTDALVRFPAEQLGPRRLPALRKVGLARGHALVHPQHVVSQRTLHHVARLAGGQRERRAFELGGQLAAAERTHGPPRARLRATGARLGQGGEALGVLLETAYDVARLVRRRHQYLTQPDPLRPVEIAGVLLAVGVELRIRQADAGEHGVGQETPHGLVLLFLGVAAGDQPAGPRFQDQDPFLEIRLEQGPADLRGQARPAAAGLDRRHVPLEVAAPDGFITQREQDGVVVGSSPGLGPA